LKIAQVRHDVGVDPMPGVVACLSVRLQPRKILLDALPDRVGAVSGLSSVMPRQMGKPPAGSLLGLGKGQDVLGVGVGYVIDGADRMKAATMLCAVVAGNPSPALGRPCDTPPPTLPRSSANRARAAF
jgi:hypothetical protein